MKATFVLSLMGNQFLYWSIQVRLPVLTGGAIFQFIFGGNRFMSIKESSETKATLAFLSF